MEILFEKQQFQEALISWYEAEKRDLPWRKTSNPYYIWVSEVMLQQTRVDTVIPYYERFISKYPTLEHLAEAKEEDLLKTWEGLGYYSRVRNLQKGAQQVLEAFHGVIPHTRKEISTLKGVGPYTAGAILSIAFGVPEHAVDGNVMRVLSRILLIEEDIAQPKTKKIFEQVVMDLIDPLAPSSFNQGLMELGATICTPNPSCLLCPVQQFCLAFEEGKEQSLPIKSKKKKSKVTSISSFALQNKEGKWLLTQRPGKGLLANLWEFPMVEDGDVQKALKTLEVTYDVQVKQVDQLIHFKHLFTHITWLINSYMGQVEANVTNDTKPIFFTAEEVEQLPKPVPVVKIWEAIKKEQGIVLRKNEENANG